MALTLTATDGNPNPNPNSDHKFSRNDFTKIADLLADPAVSPGAYLQSALDRAGIDPTPSLIQAVYDHFDSSPKLLHSLFRCSATLLTSVVNTPAWALILDRIADEKAWGCFCGCICDHDQTVCACRCASIRHTDI